MPEPARDRTATLEPLVGTWSLAMIAPGQPWPDVLPDAGARVTFEWLGDHAFLVERWSVPIPEAPDGIALLGWDDSRGTFLQHYFDTRGVARVYTMGFDGRTWTLERTSPDFSPYDFGQRFTGTLSDDGSRIDGVWEIAEDKATWAKDFDLIYTRVG
jgi:hypothetical protein